MAVDVDIDVKAKNVSSATPSWRCASARTSRRGRRSFINAQIEHAPLARALTRAAYSAGASYVDVTYRDQHVRKAMIELGPDEALDATRRSG